MKMPICEKATAAGPALRRPDDDEDLQRAGAREGLGPESRGERGWGAAATRRTVATAASLLLICPTPAVWAGEVSCTGEDDGPGIQAALDAVARDGGGIVQLGGRSTCLLRAGLRIPPGTTLRGRPALRLVAAGGDGFEQGLLLSDGGGIRLEELEIVGSAPTGPDAPPLIHIRCSREADSCLHGDHLVLRCAAPPAPPGTALLVDGEAGPDTFVRLSDLGIETCRQGIVARETGSSIDDARIRVEGPGAIGIDVGPRSDIRNARIEVSGPAADASAVGIRSRQDSRIVGNNVAITGTRGIAIATGPKGSVSDNQVDFADSPRAVGISANGYGSLKDNRISILGECPGAIGAKLYGGSNIYSNNIQRLPRQGETTHVLILSAQNLVTNNEFSSGAWGVRPPVFEGGPIAAFANGARLTGNNLIHLRKACAILQTGWHATANHCSWLGPEATGFWVGTPGRFGECSVHTLLSDNTLHTQEEGTALIRFGAVGSRCLPGSDQRKVRGPELCRTDADCAEGFLCRSTTCANIIVRDNLLISQRLGATLIDVFESAGGAAEFPELANIQVVDNALVSAQDSALVAFADQLAQGEVHDVAVGGNLPEAHQKVRGWRRRFGPSLEVYRRGPPRYGNRDSPRP